MFEVAKDKVFNYLKDQFGVIGQEISAEKLKEFNLGKKSIGWRFDLQLEDEDKPIELIFLLPESFPFDPPQIALTDSSKFLEWPHVEGNGKLCLGINSYPIDPYAPEKVAHVCLNEAKNLITKCKNGELISHFDDEFHSYWNHIGGEKGIVTSLLNQTNSTKLVYVALFKWGGYLIADTKDELIHWLENSTGASVDEKLIFKAPFIWCDRPLHPTDYKDGRILAKTLVSNLDDTIQNILKSHLENYVKRALVCFGFETINGAAFAGISFSHNKTSNRKGNSVSKGFRKGKIPTNQLIDRCIVKRCKVKRADPIWVHGRGENKDVPDLIGKTVIILGCGSVGSSLAVLLAQSGVGNIKLVDNDKLRWENISRHALGGRFIEKNKAKGLESMLRGSFPHIHVSAFDLDAYNFLTTSNVEISNCDLLISATGKWNANSEINWWQENLVNKIPVLYCWLEAYACAGHAVLIDGMSYDFKSGFTNVGVPKFKIANWTGIQTTRREPACGNYFQPYGSIEMSMSNSMMASLALDSLLNKKLESNHRIWVNSEEQLKLNGGEWANNWKSHDQFLSKGGILVNRKWPINDETSSN